MDKRLAVFTGCILRSDRQFRGMSSARNRKGLFALALYSLAPVVFAQTNALEAYVHLPDTAFAWSVKEKTAIGKLQVATLEMTSQKWRGSNWNHEILIVRPSVVRNPDIALLLITANRPARPRLEMLKILAERAGAIAAVVCDVPNQPLYDGREEDALIAYTLDQYARSGDETWPLLFPMVKSAVRGMDAVQAFADKEEGQKIKRFLVTGASKRGWTTWLTAAVDPRVAAIAPMVFDMLNMKAQTDWAQKVYGRQSEQIGDYTNLDLIARMDEPPLAGMRQWIDPYFYRQRYTMPKLILLGTNDRYWTVDSLRHYWDDLPEPKMIHQTPNGDHDLAGFREAITTLAAFFEIIAEDRPLPKLAWSIERKKDRAELRVQTDQPAKAFRLWTASSGDRDFRDDRWESQSVKGQRNDTRALAKIQKPRTGYRAYLAEVELSSPSGHSYKLSTEARVIPDF